MLAGRFLLAVWEMHVVPQVLAMEKWPTFSREEIEEDERNFAPALTLVLGDSESE